MQKGWSRKSDDQLMNSTGHQGNTVTRKPAETGMNCREGTRWDTKKATVRGTLEKLYSLSGCNEQGRVFPTKREQCHVSIRRAGKKFDLKTTLACGTGQSPQANLRQRKTDPHCWQECAVQQDTLHKSHDCQGGKTSMIGTKEQHPRATPLPDPA